MSYKRNFVKRDLELVDTFLLKIGTIRNDNVTYYRGIARDLNDLMEKYDRHLGFLMKDLLKFNEVLELSYKYQQDLTSHIFNLDDYFVDCSNELRTLIDVDLRDNLSNYYRPCRSVFILVTNNFFQIRKTVPEAIDFCRQVEMEAGQSPSILTLARCAKLQEERFIINETPDIWHLYKLIKYIILYFRSLKLEILEQLGLLLI